MPPAIDWWFLTEKMQKKPKVSLIVLTYNERAGLEKMMPRIKRSWADEILVVDYNSKDGTVELAKKMGFKVIPQLIRGRGNAFRLGLEHAKGDILVYFSPDGNEIPEDIPKLVDKINEGYDMVIASRFSRLSKSEDATFIRRLGNNIFTSVINLLFRTKLTDAVNGFRAIRKSVMQDINTDARYFDIEIQMSMRCGKNGYKTAEIPTIEPKRIEGKGKLNTFVDGWRYTKLILREFLRKEKKRRLNAPE